MNEPIPPATPSQRLIEVLTLFTVFAGLALACYGYWAWSRWRDEQAAVDRARAVEVMRCKQACDARR